MEVTFFLLHQACGVHSFVVHEPAVLRRSAALSASDAVAAAVADDEEAAVAVAGAASPRSFSILAANFSTILLYLTLYAEVEYGSHTRTTPCQPHDVRRIKDTKTQP